MVILNSYAEETSAIAIEDEVTASCDLSIEDSICLFDGKTVITPPPTIDHLIMFLTFDQTEALDQSGNKNHAKGTKNRGPGYFLSQGYSAHFKGELNVEVAPSDTLNKALADQFTVSFWIFVNKFGTLTTEQCNIIAKGNQDNIPFSVSIDVTSKQLMVTTDTEEKGPLTLTSNARLLNQRWTHVAVTRSKSIMVLYVNGNLDTVATMSAGKASAKTPLYVGRMPWQGFIGGGCSIDFFLDELKVWDQVIEEAWIEAESGLALGAGTDPHSIELGCLNCDIKKALGS